VVSSIHVALIIPDLLHLTCLYYTKAEEEGLENLITWSVAQPLSKFWGLPWNSETLLPSISY